ncbi:MAG: hypothetical protein OHK0039_33980 [Bacteroidia bacterium]
MWLGWGLVHPGMAQQASIRALTDNGHLHEARIQAQARIAAYEQTGQPDSATAVRLDLVRLYLDLADLHAADSCLGTVGRVRPLRWHLLAGEGAMLRSDYAAAGRYLDQALALAPGDIDATLLRVRLDILREDFDEAAARLETVEAAPGSLHEALHTHELGRYYLQQRLFSLAAAQFRAAQALLARLRPPGDPLRTRNQCYLGFATFYTGDRHEGLSLLDEALKYQRNQTLQYPLDLAQSILYAGSCLRAQGEEGLARAYYEEALRIRTRVLGSDHRQVAAVHNELGLLYWRLADYQPAIAHLEAAAEIYRRELGPYSNELAAVYSNIGLCYRDAGMPERSLGYFRQGLALRIERLGADHPTLFGLYNNIGLVHLASADAAAALTSFRAARRIAGARLPLHHPQRIRLCNNIARAHRDLAAYDSADYWHHRAMWLALPPGTDLAPGDLPLPAAYPLAQELIEVLNQYGLTRLAMQRAADDRLALDAFWLAAALIDTVRLGFRSEEAKAEVVARAREVYEGGMIAAWRRYAAQPSPGLIDTAFGLCERSRAIVLLEALQRTQMRQASGASLYVIERETRAGIFAMEMAIGQAQAQGLDTDSLQQRLFDRRRSYDSLLVAIRHEAPAYYQLSLQASYCQVADVYHMQAVGSAWLAYFLGERHQSLFYFSDGQVYWYLLDAGAQIPAHVAGLRQAIDAAATSWQDDSLYRRSLMAYSDHAQALHQALLGPLRAHSLPSSLMIIPDGVLGYLPFDALLYAPPSPDLPLKRWPFLLQRHSVGLHYSATLARFAGLLPVRTAGALVLAPKTTAGTSGGAPLYHSLRERAYLQDYAHARVLEGAAARKDVLLEAMQTVGLIHLSTHARARASDPARYSLELADGDSLQVGELYALHLPVELVVLSACETGAGDLQRGEGILSLARAFAYAGAHSLVATLWEVSDATSADIFVAFYRGLKAGQRKDEALRQARIDYLRQADAIRAHPFFWAGIVPSGDMRPVPHFFRARLAALLSWLLLALLPLTAGGVWYLRKKRRTLS